MGPQTCDWNIRRKSTIQGLDMGGRFILVWGFDDDADYRAVGMGAVEQQRPVESREIGGGPGPGGPCDVRLEFAR